MQTQESEVVQTTLRLPSNLRYQAKVQAAMLDISLNDFFVKVIAEAIPEPAKK